MSHSQQSRTNPLGATVIRRSVRIEIHEVVEILPTLAQRIAALKPDTRLLIMEILFPKGVPRVYDVQAAFDSAPDNVKALFLEDLDFAEQIFQAVDERVRELDVMVQKAERLRDEARARRIWAETLDRKR